MSESRSPLSRLHEDESGHAYAWGGGTILLVILIVVLLLLLL